MQCKSVCGSTDLFISWALPSTSTFGSSPQVPLPWQEQLQLQQHLQFMVNGGEGDFIPLSPEGVKRGGAGVSFPSFCALQ